MRTTLTLDDEVAVGLRKIQRSNPDKSFKEIVNQIIKKGLAVSGHDERVPFKIVAVDAIPHSHLDFDDISKLISIAEGDSHK